MHVWTGARHRQSRLRSHWCGDRRQLGANIITTQATAYTSSCTISTISTFRGSPAIQTGCWSDIFKIILGPSIFVNVLNNYFFTNHSKSIEADIGEGIAEVQLTEWFVKEGDMARNLSPPVNLHWKTTSNKRLSYDFHMTFIWLSYNFHMTFIWLSYDFHMTFMLGQRNG